MTDLEKLRHSCAHVLAQAVTELYPQTKLAIGPPVEEGFYYDMDSPHRFTEEDFPKIEARMKEIVNGNHSFVMEEKTREELERHYRQQNEPYKLEILKAIPDGEPVSVCKQDTFTDMCRGGHVKSTGEIKAFKLMSVAGAYWRGDEKNAMLQRLYGTAFFSQPELDEFVKRKEEAEKRDHRKLGKELDLFSFHQEAGAGLVHWHPKGATVIHAIEEFLYQEQEREGYQFVRTPHIASEELYRISGHLENFAENMYGSMEVEKKAFRVKPMNCPNHIMIYKAKPHSYRELPLRYAEVGNVYRFEKSGTLHGLLRVRGLTMDDAHLFCRKDQVAEEIAKTFSLILKVMARFGFTKELIKVYVANRPDKALGSEEDWNKAIQALKEAVELQGMGYEMEEKGGAFYGPKISVFIRDSLGREWQCSTVQYDFNLPERFDLTFVNAEGKPERLIMLHRAILGTFERFMAVLIEHFGGAFPLWLAPLQVMLIPITDDQVAFAREVSDRLKQEGFRVEVDLRAEKMGAKIRDAQMQKVPYMFVLGKREVEVGAVAVRHRVQGDLGAMPLDQALVHLKQEMVSIQAVGY